MLSRIGIALLACAAAFFLRESVGRAALFSDVHFVFFYSAVAVTAWFGGFAAGLFASLLSVFLENHAEAMSSGDFLAGGWGTNGQAHLLLFLLNACFISFLFGVVHASTRKARLARESVERNEKRLSTLSNLMPQLVAELRPDGSLTYLNQRWRDYVGAATPLSTYSDLLRLLHPEDLARVRQRARMTVDGLGEFEVETRIRSANGEYRWFITRASPFKDANGKVICWLGTCTDVHEQKLVLEAFAEGEERFRQLAENIRDQVFYVLDKRLSRIVYVSPAYERIWGRSVQSLYRDRFSFMEAIHPDDRHLLKPIVEGTTGRSHSIEYRLVRSDGTIRWILDRAFPICDDEGRVVRLTGIAEDITSVKHAQEMNQRITEELRASETKYRDIFTVNPLPMWIVDRESLCFLEVNDAAVRHYGFTREEFLRMTIRDIRPTSEIPALEAGIELRADAPFYRHERAFKHRRKDGSLIDVNITISRIESGGRKASLVLVNDVTQQLLAQDRLRAAMAAADEAKRLAEAASEAKTRFLANMSHEIRTPLGAILGFAELMQDPDQSVSDRSDCVATILRNGEVLSRVINDILDLSKIESDKLEIERIEVSPVDLLEQVTALLSLKAQAKGLELKVVSEGELPDEIVTDPTRLKQILFNMIGNAIKFTRAGEIEVRIRMLREPRGMMEIVIRDTGPGIPKEHQDKIFRPFTQADSSTTRMFGGTGLGLVLSKRLAQALGGDLTLRESTIGVGSAFALTTDVSVSPTAMANGAPVPDVARRPREAANTAVRRGTLDQRLAGHPRILLVEDAPDNRVLVSRFVKASGAQIECAEDGVEGVENALGSHYDLILMDIQMPRMDGLTAIRLLREKGYRGPVVALTAHAMKGDRDQCLAAGFDEHLVKPLSRLSLLGMIDRFCASPEIPPVPPHFQGATI